jgi:hypothetical protein
MAACFHRAQPPALRSIRDRHHAVPPFMALPLEVHELIHHFTMFESPTILYLDDSHPDTYEDIIGHVVKCKLLNVSRTCRVLYETILVYLRRTTFSLV